MVLDTEQKIKGRAVSSVGYTRVGKLPSVAEQGASYWIDSSNGGYEYTHQLFRFPAKFHPPVVQWAIGNYGRKKSVVFDPFTGSGTVQVVALANDISSLGIDIDPLACLVARSKTTPLNPEKLQEHLNQIRVILEHFIKFRSNQALLPGSDITDDQYLQEKIDLTIPNIPNIFHWFRRYVIIDLARILWAVEQINLSHQERLFFRICLAAIIRRTSNADPDPVSGLEVTSVQSKKNKTRIIHVFDDYFVKSRKAIRGMSELWQLCFERGLQTEARVINGDVLKAVDLLSAEPLAQDGLPLVITSPPYCRSIEYSRRHQLEMYWLGLVDNQVEHITLTHTYIGRKLVRISDWNEKNELGLKSLDDIINQIAEHNQNKARTVKHYFYSMGKVFYELKKVMKKSGTLVCVIGNSVCCKVSIPTADFIADLASEHFELKKRFSYALHNHSMQYGLWNGDGIKQEHILILKPR